MTKLNYIICFFLYSFCLASSFNEDDQRVIVRTWYSAPLNESSETQESVGHISLEIPSKEVYLSLWPDNCFLVADPAWQSIKAQFMPSYYLDILQIGRAADSIVCLYKINVDRLEEKVGNLKSNTRYWELTSSVIQNGQSEAKNHNCASVVMSALLQALFKSALDIESYFEGIYHLNDTLYPASHRLQLLNMINENWIAVNEYGLNFRAWEKNINKGSILFPLPKVSLLKVPDVVTPCTVDLWVRSLRECERKSLLVDIIPSYIEKGKVKALNYSFTRQEVINGWSIWSPLRLFTRVYWPWANSYFSEHALVISSTFFSLGFFPSNTAFSIFSGNVANFLYKLFSRKVYFYHSSRLIDVKYK